MRSDGYTKDAHEVYLASVAADPAEQTWRLVAADRLQHVASGRFLHAEQKYATVTEWNAPWEGNHSDLVTRPEEASDSQRWVFGPESFYGGKVLRQYKSGRGVDIHGWSMHDGNNVGVENSVHGKCKGVSYVFTIV